MRAASSLLFAGGTALSWSPQTTRVGASMQPRTGMLDQVEMAAICHSKPNGCGRGHRVSRFGVSNSWVTSRGCPGTAPTPQAVASSTSRFTRVAMADRQLLGDCAAVGVSDDIRFLDAELHRGPVQRYPPTWASSTEPPEFRSRPTPGASNAMTVLS